MLAERLGLDPYYVATWCRAAFLAQVCDRDGDAYWLAPQMSGLLLDEAAPTFTGVPFQVLEEPETFGRFEENLATGERLWWDQCSPEFIGAVSGTGRPCYRRLVPGGLSQVPGLGSRLEAGCRVLETACGAGQGLVLLAEAYPARELVGVDDDAYPLETAEATLGAAGLAERVSLVHSPLETMSFDEPFTAVINSISMHECRDADRVAENTRAALAPGGWFVISDFPFPDDDTGLRSAPGRVMSGIQFFEAQIDDQLVPRRFYDELLGRHSFHDIRSVSLTPMHAITYGRLCFEGVQHRLRNATTTSASTSAGPPRSAPNRSISSEGRAAKPWSWTAWPPPRTKPRSPTASRAIRARRAWNASIRRGEAQGTGPPTACGPAAPGRGCASRGEGSAS